MNVNYIGIGWSFAVACSMLVASGCVFKETYEAEKARSLNFQRLLAQEEKRTAELDNELKRIKRDTMDYEARNRELTAQVQAAREQMARVQEETDALREAIVLQQKAQEQMKQPPVRRKADAPTFLTPKPEARGDEGLSLMDSMSGSKAEVLPSAGSLASSSFRSEGATTAGRTAIRHKVKPGETMYRLSRRYGATIEQIRQWNNRKDDLLEVGEQIIVGYE